jgi:predicted nucleotidyltransferase
MISLEKILPVLVQQQVQFIIVGGVAAVIYGSAHLTSDLDICYGRSKDNLGRLVKALTPYNPELRLGEKQQEGLARLPFIWDLQTLRNGLNFTLRTDLGDIDLLGEITGIGQYEQVAQGATSISIYGVECLVISLEKLINAKQAAGRAKDLLILPELKGLLEIQQRSQEDQEDQED